MKKRNHIYIMLMTAIVTVSSCGYSSMLKKGNESYDRGEYSEAAKLYKRAYARVSTKKKDVRAEIA